MILRLLRLFPAFRELELSLQRERDARHQAESDKAKMQAVAIRAKAEIGFWRDRCLASEAKVEGLHEQLRTDTQKAADYVAMTHTHRRIYSKVDPEPPADFQPQVAKPGKVFARDLERQGREELREQLKSMMSDVTS